MHSSSLVVIVDRNEKAARAAFNASIDGGLTFIDTAEVYGSGVSMNHIDLGFFDNCKFIKVRFCSLFQAFGAINSETLLGRYTLFFLV